MNSNECATIIRRILAMEPRNAQSEWTTDKDLMYKKHLRNVPYKEASEAMEQLEATQDFRPSIAQILSAIVEQGGIPNLLLTSLAVRARLKRGAAYCNTLSDSEKHPLIDSTISAMGGMDLLRRMEVKAFDRQIASAYSKAREDYVKQACLMLSKGQGDKAIEGGRKMIEGEK